VFILEWLRIAVSFILVTFHAGLSPVFGTDSGITWSLSIVGLVLVIRIALIPLLVKQINRFRRQPPKETNTKSCPYCLSTIPLKATAADSDGTVSGVLGWQSRFRWIVRPGSDIYVVYTNNWQDDPIRGQFITQDRRFSTKALYTYRF